MRVHPSAVLFISGVVLGRFAAPAAPAADIQPRLTLGSLGHSKRVVELVFSPDGKTLTSRDEDGNVVSRDLVSGAVHMEPNIQRPKHPVFLVFSADRRLSASIVRGKDNNNSVEIRDDSGNHVIHRLQHPTWARRDRYRHEVRCMAFSADGKLLLTGGAMTRWGEEDRNGPADAIRLWDVASGTESKSFDVGRSGVCSVGLSADGKTITAGTGDGIKVWDMNSGMGRSLLGTPYTRYSSAETAPVVATVMAVGPAGRTLVAASGQEVIAWDLTRDAEWHRETAHWAPVTALAFSPTGRCFASGDADGDVRFWVINDWVQAVTQPKPDGPRRYVPRRFGHEYGELTSVVMSADGKSFAFGGAALEHGNSYPQPWTPPKPLAWVGDVATGVIKARLNGDQGTYGVDRLALSPDGKTLAAYAGARFWLMDTARGAAQQVEAIPGTADAPHGVPYAIQFTPNEKSLLVRDSHYGAKEGEKKVLFPPALRVLDRATGRLAAPIASQKGLGVTIEPGNELGFYFLGAYLLQDRTSLSRDGAFYAAPAEEESIGIWRTDTGALVTKLPGRFPLARVTLSPDGRLVVIQGRHLGDPKAGEDLPLTSVWNVATGKLLTRFGWSEFLDSRPAISPDNNSVAVARDTDLFVWSATTGAAMHPLKVKSPAFLPDNKTLVAVRENDLFLIDAASGQVQDRLVGHARRVTDFAVLPGGKSVISIGEDRTVRAWDLPAAAGPGL